MAKFALTKSELRSIVEAASRLARRENKRFVLDMSRVRIVSTTTKGISRG